MKLFFVYCWIVLYLHPFICAVYCNSHWLAKGFPFPESRFVFEVISLVLSRQEHSLSIWQVCVSSEDKDWVWKLKTQNFEFLTKLFNFESLKFWDCVYSCEKNSILAIEKNCNLMLPLTITLIILIKNNIDKSKRNNLKLLEIDFFVLHYWRFTGIITWIIKDEAVLT